MTDWLTISENISIIPLSMLFKKGWDSEVQPHKQFFPTLVETCRHIAGSTQVLTGLVSSAGCPLTSSASDALVLTGGGGLGGCLWVVAKADAAGEVKLAYSDWPISNWEKNRIHPIRAEQSFTSTNDSTR